MIGNEGRAGSRKAMIALSAAWNRVVVAVDKNLLQLDAMVANRTGLGGPAERYDTLKPTRNA